MGKDTCDTQRREIDDVAALRRELAEQRQLIETLIAAKTMPTLSELLALPAGRELDGRVAELCGTEVDWDDNNEPSEVINWEDGEVSYAPIPEVSDDMAYAWPLMAEMLAAGVSVWFGKSGDGRLLLDAWHVDYDHELTVPTLSDAPLAIVRAWLCWKLGGAS